MKENYDIICGKGFVLKNFTLKSTPVYQYWRQALYRCYTENSKGRNPTYKNCTVTPEWHNFQNFAVWFEQNYNPEIMQGWHLDKDILVKGNKIYGPNTCCFVPQEINSVLLKGEARRGVCLIGVKKDKDVFRNKPYKANITKNKKSVTLGRYATEKEAFYKYKEEKEKHIQEIAEKYKTQIFHKIYAALINYKVEITD